MMMGMKIDDVVLFIVMFDEFLGLIELVRLIFILLEMKINLL